jgi:hypothetical protein
MKTSIGRSYAPVLVIVAAAGVLVCAQPPTGLTPQVGVGQVPSPLPLSNAIRERGSSVTPAYEGWYHDRDGSVRFLVGYFNRNTKQEFDIPAGPNNRIEPGALDQGQPTHFSAGRQWGVFTLKVPPDLGTNKMTWTIVTNGFTNTVSLHTRAEWIVEPYEDAAQKNTPPVLTFQPDGPSFTGPPSIIAAHYSATVGAPLPLTAWISDEGAKVNVAPPARGRTAAADAAPPLAIAWTKFRGPGAVAFDAVKPPIDRSHGGQATTTATFDAPGEYVLRVEATDASGVGGGGFQCCWTNAHVLVMVH